MRMTSKGQVTVPQEIREKAGLRPRSEVEFEYVNGKVLLSVAGSRKGKTRGQLAVEKLSGITKGGLSTDEIMAMTRGYEAPKPRAKKRRA